MSLLQINNQRVTSVVTNNEDTIFANRIKHKYQSFQVSSTERRVLFALGTAVVLVLAVVGAFLLWNEAANSALDVAGKLRERWYWFPILLSGWFILVLCNCFSDVPLSNEKKLSTMRIVIVGSLGLITYLGVFFFIPHRLPHLFVINFLLLVLPYETLWRWMYAVVFNTARFQHRVVIIGGGERALAIAQALRQTSPANYHILGFVDDDIRTNGNTPVTQFVLGKTTDLPQLVIKHQVQEVVVALDHYVEKNLFGLLVECQELGTRVSYMPDLHAKLHHSIPIEHIDPTWALGIMQRLPNSFQLFAKRLLDLALGFLGLLLFVLILPFVALAIYLDSRGPVFYRQVRSGLAGRRFSIIKFRTMSVDAERDGEARWATKNDARITRIGHFLRKVRLDELPQVLNVLRGEMSIVGPRPERPEFIAQLEHEIPFYRIRLMVKPGLTGWAQVRYKYGNSVDDALMKLQYDCYYLHRWSLWLDLYIIFKTIEVLLKFKGT